MKLITLFVVAFETVFLSAAGAQQPPPYPAPQRTKLTVSVTPLPNPPNPAVSRQNFTVCISNTTDRDALGRKQTNVNGAVVFDSLMSLTTVLITVSRQGWIGVERSIVLRPDLNLQLMTIREGTSRTAPTCPFIVPLPGARGR
jgi:hypothetical protein